VEAAEAVKQENQKPLQRPDANSKASVIMPQGDRMNGRPAVVAARERTPGTPSRKDKPRESSAVQDPGLKDYVCSTMGLATWPATCSP
jgi:hypothetical protein